MLDRAPGSHQDFPLTLLERLSRKRSGPISIRKILALPIDPQTNNSVLASALCIGRESAAHIDFAFVKGNASEYFGPIYEGVPPDVLADMETAQARVIQETEISVRAGFDAFVARENLPLQDKPGDSVGPSASWVTGRDVWRWSRHCQIQIRMSSRPP